MDGDDSRTNVQAQNSATPWKSLQKLDSIFLTLQPGDSVLFKRGQVFFGQITVSKSGLANSPIILGAYGVGVNPIISGFELVSIWTHYAGSVYYASLDAPSINLVTVDGIIKPMGRYPNTNYLTYTSNSNNYSISGETIGLLPFNPANAELVIKKNRWILDRHKIISKSSNALIYSTDNSYGNNKAYTPIDGNGYFIQNPLKTLDTAGEWYFDKANMRLYIHFGSEDPSGKIIKASKLDRNFTINSQSFINFNNIDFEGSNSNGGYFVGASNIVLNNCNFNQNGGNAIYGISVYNFNYNGGSVSNSLNNVIWVKDKGHYCSIDKVKVSNTGMFAGAGRSGDGAQEGIEIGGNNAAIKNCTVINTGCNGICFGDNRALIGQ